MRVKGRFISAGNARRLNRLEDIRRHKRSLIPQRTGANPAAASVDPHTTTACRHSAERFRFGGRRIVELDYVVEQLARGCWFCGSYLKVTSTLTFAP